MKFRLFANNTAYKIGAVLFAAALWIWVGIQDNPVEEKILLVPVAYSNLSSEQMIASQEDFVNVRIEGRKGDLDFIFSRDVRARVDLSNAQTGENSLRVQVEAPVSVKVIDVSPRQATVVIDRVVSQQWPVQTTISGSLQPGYLSLDPQLTPNDVILEGAESLLETVAGVTADVILNEDVTYNKVVPLRVLNQNGQDITELVRLTPDTVEVYLPVYSRSSVLEKPVHVPLTGSPAPGFRVTGLELEPRFVVVNGDFMSFMDLPYYATEEVALDGATETFSLTVNVVNPNEFVPISPTQVNVVVKVERQ